MKYVLTVTLNPALDQFIWDKGVKTLTLAGGKGINVSRALDCLGVATLITGIVGGETGQILQTLLEKERLSFDFLEVSPETRTNLTLINSHKTRRSISHGEIVSENIGEQFLKKYIGLLLGARVVIISGRFLPGLPIHLISQLIHLAKKKRIPVIVDTHGAALKEALKAKPFMIKINKEELKELLGLTKQSEKDIMRAIQWVHQQGIQNILISLGKTGAIGSDGKKCWRICPPPIKDILSVGCGDSMIGGFVYSYLKGHPFLENALWATAAGTANVKHVTPGFIKINEVKKIIKLIKIKEKN
jgi:1-phosphofructokinase family hexose kinase